MNINDLEFCNLYFGGNSETRGRSLQSWQEAYKSTNKVIASNKLCDIDILCEGVKILEKNESNDVGDILALEAYNLYKKVFKRTIFEDYNELVLGNNILGNPAKLTAKLILMAQFFDVWERIKLHDEVSKTLSKAYIKFKLVRENGDRQYWNEQLRRHLKSINIVNLRQYLIV